MSSLIRFTPNSDLRRMQREFDRLFENLVPFSENGDETQSVWAPRVDFSETEDTYLIYLDVPGLDKDQINLNYHDGALSVSGERTKETRDERENFMRVERQFGSFFRSFKLPKTIVADKIVANYADGVLTVTVPKAEETKPKRIAVK